MEFFTSDLHLNHVKILEYCPNRVQVFGDLDSHNRGLISRWNERVGADDVVYFLGDFAMGMFDRIEALGRQLSGRKILIRGNHEAYPKRKVQIVSSLFDEVYKKRLVIERECVGKILLKHHPAYGEADQYDLHFCGHVHDLWKVWKGKIVNVSVDVWDYRPATLDEILCRVRETQGKEEGSL